MSSPPYPMPTARAAEFKEELPPLERQDAPALPPPNGGIAWLSVLAGFLGFVIAWGPASGSGSFQDYYESDLLTQSSSSKISWVGTMNAFLLISTGVCSGPFFDRGYGRSMICVGCVAVVFGMMVLSLSQEYYQVMLSHGICVGVGSGFVYVPLLALVNSSFVGMRRAIANGIVASGGSAGGILFPIIILRLLPRIGFPWTARVLGFLQLGCFLIILPIIFTVPFPKPTATRSLIHWDAFREPAFSFYAVSSFLVMIGYFVPMVYVPVYATQQLNLSRDTGMYLLAGLNAGSALGRISSSLIVEKIGAANMLLAATSACGIILLAWISVISLPGLAVFSVLFGVFSGVIIATLPLVVVHPLISPQPGFIGTRMGMLWFLNGLGLLIGSPIAGSLMSTTSGNQFMGLQIFAGVVMLASMLFLSVTVAIFQRYRKSLMA